MTGRTHMADAEDVETLYAAMDQMREALEATRPDALLVIAAEHFANFFMNNMPAYCMGMADEYEGPIEDPEWLGPETKDLQPDPKRGQRLPLQHAEAPL